MSNGSANNSSNAAVKVSGPTISPSIAGASGLIALDITNFTLNLPMPGDETELSSRLQETAFTLSTTPNVGCVRVPRPGEFRTFITSSLTSI